MQGDSAAPAPSGKKPGTEDAQWQYKPDDTTSPANPAAFEEDEAPETDIPEGEIDEIDEVSWTASEFIAHRKSARWYGVLTIGAVALIVGLFFWTHDFVSIVAVVIMAIILGLTAGHKPRAIEYRLDRAGLAIGQKFYPYEYFRSFAVVDEGVVSSIMFAPLKRFMPPLTIYYDPEDEERIIGVLSKYLPFQQTPPDMIDRFARRIRF
jgi:hypothetical protein